MSNKHMLLDFACLGRNLNICKYFLELKGEDGSDYPSLDRNHWRVRRQVAYAAVDGRDDVVDLFVSHGTDFFSVLIAIANNDCWTMRTHTPEQVAAR